MATIEDPNVVRLTFTGRLATPRTSSWSTFQDIAGRTHRRRGPLPIAEVCRIGLQVCYGLTAAAARGIVV